MEWIDLADVTPRTATGGTCKAQTLPDCVYGSCPSLEHQEGIGRQYRKSIVTTRSVGRRIVVGVVVFCATVAILVLWRGIVVARNSAIKAKCCSRLSMIGCALANYKDAHGTFPPAYLTDDTGKPMHSWRVLILPYLEQNALYSQYHFDEPWNSENNRRLAPCIPSEYRCPGSLAKDETTTSFVAVVGPNAAWPGNKPATESEIGDANAHFNTIAIVEVADSGIDWMEPRDMHLEDASRGVNTAVPCGIGSSHPHGANCLTMDGLVHFLDNGISASLLTWLLRVDPAAKKSGGPIWGAP
jgi:hypothetical protein